jgi:predicted nucleic acid-binding protein
MLYVIDTSSLVDAWSKWYSPLSIPTFWNNLESIAKDGKATLPDAVLMELEEQDDDLRRWCQERRDFLCTPTTDDVQRIITDISNCYPNLRRAGIPTRNFADPVVIAVAIYLNSAVVTHENATGNLNGPRIPDVCRDRGIRVIQIHHLVSEQGWVFR